VIKIADGGSGKSRQRGLLLGGGLPHPGVDLSLHGPGTLPIGNYFMQLIQTTAVRTRRRFATQTPERKDLFWPMYAAAHNFSGVECYLQVNYHREAGG
jgi:hypothetical protein